MEIKVTEKDNQTIIALNGMLDSTSAPAFQDVVNKQMEKEQMNLVLDLEQLAYTSSQGIRTFLTLLKAAASKQGKLVFRHIQPAVLEVFDMSGLTQAMTIEE